MSADSVDCWDHPGFVAIGAGALHAESQMMFGRHSASKDLASTVFLVFSSKKRAEVAPSVGERTDMLIVSHPLVRTQIVDDEVIKKMGLIFKKSESQATKARSSGVLELDRFLKGRSGTDSKQPIDGSSLPLGGPEAGTE